MSAGWWFLSCLFQLFLFGIVYAGMMMKKGAHCERHQIAGMIAAYFISCFMLGFLTWNLKASDRGMFISDEKKPMSMGEEPGRCLRMSFLLSWKI